MELASGMRSWMTWAPADLSLEETARHQYKGRQRALQTRCCCWGGQTGHRAPHTATVAPPGLKGGARGCWALTSQLLRSRCRSLMWLLSASPCSNALEKSPKPSLSASNGGTSPCHGEPQQSRQGEWDAGEGILPRALPLPALHSIPPLHQPQAVLTPSPFPSPYNISWQLGTCQGDVSEGAGLAEKLLDVRGDGFHPPEKDGHNVATTATQQQPLPAPLTPCQGLPVGVHVFGEVQVDEAAVGSVHQGSKELPGWGCEPWAGGPRGAAQPGDGGTLCQVLTASKGQSVPARLRCESEWQWRRRLCRFCESRGGSAASPLGPNPHPAALEPQFQPVSSLLLSTGVNPARRNPLSHGIQPCCRWHLPHSQKKMQGCPQGVPSCSQAGTGSHSHDIPIPGVLQGRARTRGDQSHPNHTGDRLSDATPSQHTHTDVIPSQGAWVSREVQVPEGESDGFVVCESLAQRAHPCSDRGDRCRLQPLHWGEPRSRARELPSGWGSRTSHPWRCP